VDEKVKADIKENIPQNFFHLRAGFKIMLRYLAAFGLLAALFYYGVIDFRPLGSLWEKPWVLMGLVAFAWLTLPLVVWRWWILLHGQGIQISYFDVFRVSYFSAFAGMLLPGMVGGDVTRILLCKNVAPNGVLRYSCSVVVDRVFGIFGLLGVGLVACSAYYREILDDRILRYEVVLIMAVFLGGIFILLLIGMAAPRLLQYMRNRQTGGKIGEMLVETIAAFADYAESRRVLCAAMLISLLAHAKDLDHDGDAGDPEEKFFSAGSREFFGVVDTGEGLGVFEDHGRGDHGTRQGTAARFIHAGEPALKVLGLLPVKGEKSPEVFRPGFFPR